MAVLSLIAIVVIFILCGDDLIARLGNLTAWSAAFFLATIAFAVAAVASAIALWRAPAEAVRRGVRRYSTRCHCGPADSHRRTSPTGASSDYGRGFNPQKSGRNRARLRGVY